MPVVILKRREAATPHTVDVQRSAQMVDFVLQDARIPARGLDAYRLTKMIQSLNQDQASARYDTRETGKAETTFKESNFRLRHKMNLRVDQNMKRHRAALAFRQVTLGKICMIFSLVLNDGKLQRLAYL